MGLMLVSQAPPLPQEGPTRMEELGSSACGRTEGSCPQVQGAGGTVPPTQERGRTQGSVARSAPFPCTFLPSKSEAQCGLGPAFRGMLTCPSGGSLGCK